MTGRPEKPPYVLKKDLLHQERAVASPVPSMARNGRDRIQLVVLAYESGLITPGGATETAL